MADDDKPEDRYERAAEPTSINKLLGDIDGLDPETLGHSAEWWAQRDREVAEAKGQRAADDERSRMSARAGELRENGFPEMFVTAALGELDDTEALRFARLFMNQPTDWKTRSRKLLVLAGGVGAGKTTAASWIALKGQDPRPGFLRIAELERRGRYDKKLNVWLNEKTSLVIDDVGAEVLDGKGVFRSLMDEVVDIFYSNRRTLVMTTNLRPRITDEMRAEAEKEKRQPERQFAERYGDRVWSRVSQLGLWADCGMQDLRRKKQP